MCNIHKSYFKMSLCFIPIMKNNKIFKDISSTNLSLCENVRLRSFSQLLCLIATKHNWQSKCVLPHSRQNVRDAIHRWHSDEPLFHRRYSKMQFNINVNDIWHSIVNYMYVIDYNQFVNKKASCVCRFLIKSCYWEYSFLSHAKLLQICQLQNLKNSKKRVWFV